MSAKLPARERFALLQTAAQTAAEQVRHIQIDLRWSGVGYASRTDKHKLEVAEARARRAFEKFFAFLTTIAGRNFESGFPCAWLRDALTYEDAITLGQMSIVPPPSWGLTEHDMRTLAAPVRK